MNKIVFFLLSTIIIVSGCNKQDSPDNVIYPTNLVVSIEESATIEGLVNVEASASSANYYVVEFFTNTGSTSIQSNDGNASYQYTESGSYTVKVSAHSSFEHFISTEDAVEVTVTQPIVGIPTTGYSTPMSYPNYTLVWNDEFDGNTLGNNWTHEIGTGNNGWGNNELQYYRAENTEVSDGYLIITAKNEFFGGKNYTSSRIITQGMQSFQYGRIDIRAALPYGKGLWPALWMLGDSYTSVGWPSCGEIDIMEMVGGDANGEDNTVHGTIHWSNNGSYASFGGSNQLSSGKFAEEFHVFTIIWDENLIRWYRDDILYHTVDITPSALSEFHEEFFFIFNVAVGGNWPGSPNSSTQFPQQMAVDYVRVFQQ